MNYTLESAIGIAFLIHDKKIKKHLFFAVGMVTFKNPTFPYFIGAFRGFEAWKLGPPAKLSYILHKISYYR